MEEIGVVTTMQAWADRTRGAGERIGLVPTMGYLHDGHLSLVREARRRSDRCVASIFVNPLQFGPNEDFARYPRAAERDREQLAAAGVDVLFAPDVAAMYPAGFQTTVRVGKVTQGLCGRSRPGHFDGVTTVVAKLFNAVKPHLAVFGEKDLQQLVAIRRMAADLGFDLEVAGMPIVREPDGVAMSSRNAYLNETERRAARCLRVALAAAASAVAGGERSASDVIDRAVAVLGAEPLARVDYVELVAAEDLEPVASLDRPCVLALAVRIGGTRLIDNIVLEP
jgi:pantoate--beta-alanine ligase